MKLTDLHEGLRKPVKQRRTRKGWVVYNAQYDQFGRRLEGGLASESHELSDMELFDSKDEATHVMEKLNASTNDWAYGDEPSAVRVMKDPKEYGSASVAWAKRRLSKNPIDKQGWQIHEMRVTYEF